jgi:hypothetical protein
MSRAASDNSLSARIRAILRASATAEAPLNAAEIRERLIAMGVDDIEDIYNRLSHLVHRGEIATTGEVRGKRYWMSDRFTPAARAKRKKRPDGEPTLTLRVLDFIAANPGAITAQVTAHLVAAGVELREGQPSTTISRLHDRGQLRSEGTRQRRGYFVVADQVNGANAQADAPSLGKPSRKSGKSEISTDRSTPCGPTPPATDIAAGEASIPRTEGSAVTAGKDRHFSDDPIDRLADAIQQHLELSAAWITSTLIAEDLDEEPLDVAKALRRLVETKRTNVRTLDGVREYAVGLDAEPAATPTPDATRAEASPFEFSRELPPVPEADRAAHRDAIEAAREALRDRYNDATAHPPSIPPPAYHPEQVSFRNTQIANLVAAIGSNPNTVAGLSRCIALDIEDAIGRACDQHMPHHAIKALATAAACMRRAIDTFTTGAPAPLTATDGVLQS